MKYLLDSNICIHFFRGKFGIYELLESVGLKNCAISEITLAELVFGAEKSDYPQKNKEIINEYCQKMGFEKYSNSKNITIYNSVNTLSLNSNYKISRIFLLDNKKVYLTMIKENYKMNIPVLFSQIILKKEIEKLIKK